MKITKVLILSSLFCTILIQNSIALDWKTYWPSGSHITILFPKEPVMCRKSVTTKSGMLLDNYQALADYGDYAFLMTFADYSEQFVKEKGKDELLEDVLAGYVGQEKFISTKNITLDSHPGRAYVFNSSGMEVKGYVYLVGHRLYQLVTAYSPEEREALSNDIDTFLNSLALKQEDYFPNPDPFVYKTCE
jgi:hypothetical protein